MIFFQMPTTPKQTLNKFTCKSVLSQSFLFIFYVAFDTFLRGGSAQICVQETSRKCCFSVIYSFQNSKFRPNTRPRRAVGNNIQKSYTTILELALLFSSHRKRGQCEDSITLVMQKNFESKFLQKSINDQMRRVPKQRSILYLRSGCRVSKSRNNSNLLSRMAPDYRLAMCENE